jgi:serine O-acetyltransferase
MEPLSDSSPKLAGRAPPLPDGGKNENPRGLGFLALLREDLLTYEGDWLAEGFWALAVHRFGNWRMGIRHRLVRAPCTIIYRVLRRVVQVTCGIKLDYTVKIGRRLRIEHFGGMILGARSIGDDVVIRQNTTFGIKSRDDLNAKPIIEDRVDIGAGACIIGNVRIGHDSVIGANAVVTTDIPPRAVAVGVPAKVIKIRAGESA